VWELAMGNVEEQVEAGLSAFRSDRLVSVPLHDLLYTYKAIGVFIQFFHQPLNYPDLNSIQQFIGDKDNGALHVLWDIYYRRLCEIWPEDVRKAFDEGMLE
jgi:hypothetical protein